MRNIFEMVQKNIVQCGMGLRWKAARNENNNAKTHSRPLIVNNLQIVVLFPVCSPFRQINLLNGLFILDENERESERERRKRSRKKFEGGSNNK